MSIDFEPYVVGMVHTEKYIDEIFNAVQKRGVKRVGIELPPALLRHFRANYTANFFWGGLIHKLENAGMVLIPLVPRQFENLNPTRAGAAILRFEQEKKHNPVSALIDDVMTRRMEKKAAKEKVELILVGNFHAMLMRKDLRVPKSKMQLLNLSPELRLQSLADVKMTRRYIRSRKKRTLPAPTRQVSGWRRLWNKITRRQG